MKKIFSYIQLKLVVSEKCLTLDSKVLNGAVQKRVYKRNIFNYCIIFVNLQMPNYVHN